MNIVIIVSEFLTIHFINDFILFCTVKFFITRNNYISNTNNLNKIINDQTSKPIISSLKCFAFSFKILFFKRLFVLKFLSNTLLASGNIL